jgi:hypothetical protein
MTANAHRGEIKITLEGAAYVLRPDFEAAAAIDTQLGSIIDVTRRALAENSLSFREIAVIVCEGMRAQGRATGDQSLIGAKLPRVQQMVFEAGMVSLQPAVLEFLANAITGGATPAGNAEATATGTA